MKQYLGLLAANLESILAILRRRDVCVAGGVLIGSGNIKSKFI